MKNHHIIILLLVLTSVPTISFSQNFSDYLILQDIGPYKLEAPKKVVGGYIGGPRVFDGAGVIAPTGHFYPDHTDKTYEAYYEGESTLPSATVQVTKHADPPEAIKWLLHEVDADFRTYYGIPGVTYGPRELNGQILLEDTAGGAVYRWLSGTKVINIHYVDLEMTKPEPIEIVLVYLAKHPSTLSPMTLQELRSTANKTAWIKDEMDHRLWLCDKWILQITIKKADEKQVYQESVKSMNVFLDYREKYYAIKATDEKNLLAGYLIQNNGTSIKTKLKEYKDWWTFNKDKAITLP